VKSLVRVPLALAGLLSASIMNTMGRILVGLTSLAFFAVALSFWIAPARTAGYFGIEAASGQGLVSVCADFGGLFLGMGSLSAFGAITRRRGALLAAATMLGAITMGRIIGWITNAGAPIGARELAIEVGTMCALLLFARPKVGLERVLATT